MYIFLNIDQINRWYLSKNEVSLHLRLHAKVNTFKPFYFPMSSTYSQLQFKGFDIGGWLIHSENNFPAMQFVLFVFCCKTDAQGDKKLPSIFFTKLITSSSFVFGWYSLRNNSSLTYMTEFYFGFPYWPQVNFSMTLNSFSYTSENLMSPNTAWTVLLFSSIFNGKFFPFLKTLQYNHCN